MEAPSLESLVESRASFAVVLLGADKESQEEVTLEQNDFDVCIVGAAGDRSVTLFRSAHGPVARAVLRGTFLQNRQSAIDREAILGLYPRLQELAVEERQSRREAAFALLDKPEEDLSPEERRVVGVLRYGMAKLEMFRVFGSAPAPGQAREKLHLKAIGECMAVCRILGPLVAEAPRIDDVGMTFWAASSLAHYYLKGGDAGRAVQYAEAAVDFVQEAALRDPDEPEYQRWSANGIASLAEAQAATGDQTAAMASLDASIEILRALYQALPTTGRHLDLREAVESAMRVSERWMAVSSTERQRWVELSNTLEAEKQATQVKALDEK
jgi:hypothetical protein